MIHHVLTRCYECGFQLFTFDGGLEKNSIRIKGGASPSCPRCFGKNPNYSPSLYTAYVEYKDPSFVLKKLQISFGDKYTPTSHPVVIALASLGFYNLSNNSYSEYKFETRDGYKLFLNKRQSIADLYFVVPEDFKLDNVIVINKQINRELAEGREKKEKPIIPESIQDAAGQQCIIGDWVAYSSSGKSQSDLNFGCIKKFNPTGVSIKPINRKCTTPKKSCQFVKVPSDLMLIKLMEN